ncbi:MAG: fasciclin domain-containing protein [Pseudomonas sp.]
MFALTQGLTQRVRYTLLALFSASVLVAAPAYAGSHGGDKAKADKPDIVDTAIAAGSFSTLVTAVQAADLVDTLKGEGPFTVFAPTDEAFAKIPQADLEALLADKDKLTAVLTYHVVVGKVMAADVAGMTSAETVQGSSLTISTTDGVMVDDATVVTTDIKASNGVIHVIDTVLMP